MSTPTRSAAATNQRPIVKDSPKGIGESPSQCTCLGQVVTPGSDLRASSTPVHRHVMERGCVESDEISRSNESTPHNEG